MLVNSSNGLIIDHYKTISNAENLYLGSGGECGSIVRVADAISVSAREEDVGAPHDATGCVIVAQVRARLTQSHAVVAAAVHQYNWMECMYVGTYTLKSHHTSKCVSVYLWNCGCLPRRVPESCRSRRTPPCSCARYIHTYIHVKVQFTCRSNHAMARHRTLTCWRETDSPLRPWRAVPPTAAAVAWTRSAWTGSQWPCPCGPGRWPRRYLQENTVVLVHTYIVPMSSPLGSLPSLRSSFMRCRTRCVT